MRSLWHGTWTVFGLLGVLSSFLVVNQISLGAEAMVVFTEIMLNPKNAAHGQWFELFNAGDTAVSLNGWQVEGHIPSLNRYFVYNLPSRASIAAKGYFTIGQSNVTGYIDSVFQNLPSFPVDGSAPTSKYNYIALDVSNGSFDDYVYWNAHSNSSTPPSYRLPFPSTSGASLSRKSANGRTQDPSDWCTSSTYVDNVTNFDRATPRTANVFACPTNAPTKAPTKKPTSAPTKAPTKKPTRAPTTAPTKKPTRAPTTAPTKKPTRAPTRAPTAIPTKKPTTAPTKIPTRAPLAKPTTIPTRLPTKVPLPAPVAADAPVALPKSSPVLPPVTAPMSPTTKVCTKQCQFLGGLIRGIKVHRISKMNPNVCWENCLVFFGRQRVQGGGGIRNWRCGRCPQRA